MKKIPIGLKDYRKLKEENYYVVDKSLMIKEFMDRGSEVTLITRPRRFGKTINMSRRCPPLVCLLNFLMLRRIPWKFLRILPLCSQNMQRISIHIRQSFYPLQMLRAIRIILSCR
ncbi:MAG: AAA family ATPase [Clostridium sp.]